MYKPSQDPFVIFQKWAHELPRAQLGGLLKEYIAESNHGSWDGFSKRDLSGIRNFLTDLMTYHDNHTDQQGLATHVNNINTVA